MAGSSASLPVPPRSVEGIERRRPGGVAALAAMAASMTSTTLVMVFVPLAGASLHLDNVLIGLLVAVPALVQMVTTIPAGAAVDRFGSRPLLLSGGAIASSGALVLVLWSGVPGLVVGSALFGAGSSFTTGAALATLGKTSRRRIATVQGLNVAAQRGGALVAALIVTAGIGGRGALVFIPVLAATMVMGVVGAFTPVNAFPGSGASWLQSSFRRGVRLIVERPEIQVSALFGILIATLLTVSTSFVPLMLLRDYGAAPSMVGTLLVVRDVVAVIAGPVLGWWAQRAGPRPMQMTGLVTLLLGTAGLASASLRWTLIPCFASQGVGLAAALVATNLWAAIGSLREERALALAVGGYMFRIAAFTAPILLGWLFDRSPITMIAGATVLCATVAVLITWRSASTRGLPLAQA